MATIWYCESKRRAKNFVSSPLLPFIEAQEALTRREYDSVDALIPASLYLGVLGYPGQTAYWGILDVGKIQPGELVVVSGAAGAVGTIVCQIAKLKGCKVVAIAGSKEKCDYLTNELGVDVALNYKDPNFVKDFRKIGYLDVYFDNVSWRQD
jgi:NADPH-dependent curcumin reductase CurA